MFAPGVEGKYVIYHNENPPQIDVSMPVGEGDERKWVKVEGVYFLDGDTLGVHLPIVVGGKPLRSRPDNFLLDAKSPSAVRTLKRVKK